MPILLILLLIPVAILALLLLGAALWTASLARMAERLVPRPGQMQKVRGGAIHYVESGNSDAPAVVLIHGLSAQLQHYTYGIVPLLEQQFRVIALDRPGCGYSERDHDTLAALPEQAKMIWEALDALGVETPLLVGHSLGGAVALAMALERPGAASGLALISPLTHRQPEEMDAFRGLDVPSAALRRLIGYTIAAPLAQRTATTVLTEVFRPEAWPDDFLARGGGALGLRPKGFISASADYMAANDGILAQEGRYADELKTPGGVLFGAEDNLLPPDTQGRPMMRYGLHYEAAPGRGHMLPITAPGLCADFIQRMAARE
ncbi:alpha/beta fold hydrolase [Pseudodonghicola flavimaris]|uniref:Alpha/beta fold hydrolase n=1 Tax=Pseudodonghicola flavimaris TaxID=3050036 RepID=A0ABT7F3D5_9RHOB|nr:alpha/beta fold hydrolase [Pseudodonghicola flavimaris]MDK3018944.1 alpha/beta fold hydrolase [Pseudodonghicola flavimaris]